MFVENNFISDLLPALNILYLNTDPSSEEIWLQQATPHYARGSTDCDVE